MSFLAVSSATPVTRLSLGAFRAVLSGNVVPAGFIDYRNILEVYDNSGNRVYAVASEANRLARTLGGGSHFLCAYDNGNHINYGASDEWADTGKFLNGAVDLVRKRFEIPATEPALPVAAAPAPAAKPEPVFAEPLETASARRQVSSRTGLLLGAGLYVGVILVLAVVTFAAFAFTQGDLGRLTLLPEVLLHSVVGWRIPLAALIGALSGLAAARTATRSSEGGVDLAPLHIVRWARSIAGVLVAKYRLRRHGILSGNDAPAWVLPGFFLVVTVGIRAMTTFGVMEYAGPLTAVSLAATVLLADTILINVVARLSKN